MYLQSALEEKDIPHRTKLQAETLSRAKVVEKKISEVFKACLFFINFVMGIYSRYVCDF